MKDASLQYQSGSVLADRYTVVRHLGVGSIGRVLLVRDQQLDNQLLALKVLHDGLLATEEVHRRLQAEVILARQLSHPNIVRIYEFEQTQGGLVYITMEYVEGCSLAELLGQYVNSTLPYEEGYLVVQGILQGLSFAHQKKIVHRDLKPENILIDRGGRVKLSDFGFAASFEDSFGFTRTGQSIGTPSYMAPELFLGPSSDPRVDIYSLGVVLYEMLTGTLPFAAETFYEVAKQHREIPADLGLLERSNVHPEVIALIGDCLAKEVDGRPANILSVSARLLPPEKSVEKVSRLHAAVQLSEEKVPFFKRPFSYLQTIWSIAAWSVALMTLLYVDAAQSRAIAATYRLESNFGLELQWLMSVFGMQEHDLDDPQVLFEVLKPTASPSTFALLNSGIDLSVRNQNGRTLLHEAIYYSPYKLPLVLHAIKSKPEILELKTPDGKTALTLAVVEGLDTTVTLLLEAGASANILDNSGNNALHYAASNGSWTVLKQVMEHSKVPIVTTVKNADGYTALHLAVRSGSLESVSLLLENNYDANLRSSSGATPLMLVLEGHYDETQRAIAEVLLAAGANLSAVRDDGATFADLVADADTRWQEFFETASVNVK